MKNLTRHIGICAAFITLLSIQSASALKYEFWWAGWPNGGEVTGSLEIDETKTLPGFPNVCFNNAVISLNAHWSGDPYSQPYDWDTGDVGSSFWWDIPTHRIEFMDLGTGSAWPIFIDGSILVDYRSFSYTYYIHAIGPIQGRIVPDAGSTLLFLGLALASLIPLRSLLRRGHA